MEKLKILLSSVLYNLAFYFPDKVGFLILFFWVPLLSIKFNFANGIIWGFFIFTPHCVWLLILLLTKSQASLVLSILAYTFIVLYFVLTAGIFFYLSGKLRYPIFTLPIYFYFLNYYSLWIVDVWRYPFFSPAIPLASYKPFLKVLAFIYGPCLSMPHFKIYHLKPDIGKYRESPEIVGQRIYHKLASMNLEDHSLIVATESSFPFDLEKNQKQLTLWTHIIPLNTHLLLGAHYKRAYGNVHQSIYWIWQGRIMKRYDKHHLIPFVEYLPKLWKELVISKEFFLKERCNFTASVENVGEFDILGTSFDIKVCSEMFFCDITASIPVLCFINDSWFTGYFKKWLINYIRIKSAMLGVPILYIGCEELLI